MASGPHSFIDIAVLQPVRARFAAGDALAILTVDLETVIWANGAGAALLGHSDIETVMGAPSGLALPARRQIAATPGFPRAQAERPVAVRLARGMSSRLATFMVAGITLPDGEPAVLVAEPATRQGSQGPAGVADRVIEGIGEAGYFAAIVDADATVVARSDGFDALGIEPATLAALVSEVARADDRLVKRLVSGAAGMIPAGIARLADDPALHLLIAIDDAEDDADEDVEASSETQDMPKGDENPVTPDAPLAAEPAAPATEPDGIVSDPSSGSADAALAHDAAPSDIEASGDDADEDDEASSETQDTPQGGDNPVTPDSAFAAEPAEQSTERADTTVSDLSSEGAVATLVQDAPSSDIHSSGDEHPLASDADLPERLDEDMDFAAALQAEDHDVAEPYTPHARLGDEQAEAAPSAAEPVGEDASSEAGETDPDAAVEADDEPDPSIAVDSSVETDADLAGSSQSAETTDSDDWYFSRQSDGQGLTARAAPPPPPPSPIAERASGPVRFVWRTDAVGAFSMISPEFAAAVGAKAADVVGSSFSDVADRFGLDPDGEIARLLERRDTWSGRTVLWPVQGTDLVVPVDLAALPNYGRDRSFEGFRGFGVARMSDALVDPSALGLALDRPTGEIEPDAGVEPTIEVQDDLGPDLHDQTGREPEAPDDQPPVEGVADTPETDEGSRASDPFRGEVPVISIADRRERRASDKIIRLAEHRPASVGGQLSPGERSAFEEIRDRLRRDYETAQNQAATSGTTDEQPEAAASNVPVPAHDDSAAPTESWRGEQPVSEPDLEDNGDDANFEAVGDDYHDLADVAALDGTDSAGLAGHEQAADAAAEPEAADEDGDSMEAARDAAAASGMELPSEAHSSEPSAQEDDKADDSDDVARLEAIDSDHHGVAEFDDADDAMPEQDRPVDDLTVETEERTDPASHAAPAAVHDGDDTDDAPLHEVQLVESSEIDAEVAAYGEAAIAEARDDRLTTEVDFAADPVEEHQQDDHTWLGDDAADETTLLATEGRDASIGDVEPEAQTPPAIEATDDVSLVTSDDTLVDADTAVPADAQVASHEQRTERPIETVGIVPSAFAEDVRRSGVEADLIAGLPLPILIHAGDDLYFANRAFLALTGYSSLDQIRREGGLGRLFAEGEPPMAAGDDDRKLRVRTLGGDEFPVDAHLQSIRWNSGTALLLALSKVSSQPATISSAPAAQASDLSDIDEMERRVAEMRTIVDTATDGVVLIARDGTIRSISRAAEALFGFDSAEVEGKPFHTLFAIESQRAARDYLNGLADNGVASVLNDGREVIGREAEGRFIPLFMTIGRLPQQSGFCAVVRDITQWKRAEEELTQARAQAERASSQKTEFLARVSHEIRTPLNAIIGFSELMIDEKFGPIHNDRYRDYLRDINRSGNHVLDLVNDLLDISKIEAGEQEMNYEAVSLNDTLAECVAMMQPQANRDRVIIRSSLASRLPEVVADLRSVRQIALNLLSNAIRYTQAGGQVIVSTSYEPSGDVVMRLRDTGIGMTLSEIDQAMKPFKQINALKRSRHDGTGLGLPLTKAMVEANRARFVISSTPGEGTMVEITFPSTRVLAD
jgi:PAS domain S-box-containing protein